MALITIGLSGCGATWDPAADDPGPNDTYDDTYVGPPEPVDDPATLPNEAYGPSECDVDYDPDYCGDYHGP